MFPKIDPLTTPAWQSLQKHYDQIKEHRITDLFAHDKNRFSSFSISHGEILFDYSKNLITEETRDLLLQLAEDCGLKDAISAMFHGEKINETENRSVLHVALRDFTETHFLLEGQNIKKSVNDVREQMKIFCEKVHDGRWVGFTQKKIKYIVNIGIGGSDLGPVMVTEALKPYWQPGIEAHFVSNVDGTDIAETLKTISAEETIFIIASKTFTTQETMTNALSAREWFLENGGNEDDIAKHFVAVSTNTEAVVQFGINKDNMFVFWDWVGGRYSLWSSIGLSIALTIGYQNFQLLLKGAEDVDMHFRDTPFQHNIPVLMALIGIWTRNFQDAHTEAILPYDQYMHRFPAYLQQGNMESNGKHVDRNGNRVRYETGPVIWGESGTNGQHAFYQLIHQGTQIVACDFIAPAQTHNELGEHHKILLSNFFAQPEALMNGADNTNHHKNFEGNRPSNSFLITRITPFTLGQLIALYEHKIFVQGVIWNIYSFDQFGVELGKTLAKKILPELKGLGEVSSHDSSTNGLINAYKNMRTY